MHSRMFLEKTMRDTVFHIQHNATPFTISIVAVQFRVRHAELRWCKRVVQLGLSYTKNVNVIFDKQCITEFISHTIDIVMSDKHVFRVVSFEAMNNIKAIWIWVCHYRLRRTDIKLAFVITALVKALRRVMWDIFMAMNHIITGINHVNMAISQVIMAMTPTIITITWALSWQSTIFSWSSPTLLCQTPVLSWQSTTLSRQSHRLLWQWQAIPSGLLEKNRELSSEQMFYRNGKTQSQMKRMPTCASISILETLSF